MPKLIAVQTASNCRWIRLDNRFFGIRPSGEPTSPWRCVRLFEKPRSVTEEECARASFGNQKTTMRTERRSAFALRNAASEGGHENRDIDAFQAGFLFDGGHIGRCRVEDAGPQRRIRPDC